MNRSSTAATPAANALHRPECRARDPRPRPEDDNRDVRSALGEVLRAILLREAISQSAAAAEIGISASSMSNYLRGRRQIPTTVMFALLRLIKNRSPMPPPGLLRLLVLLGYDTPWDQGDMEFRWDTLTVEVPVPEAPGNAEERIVVQQKMVAVQAWIESVTERSDDEGAQRRQFRRMRVGLRRGLRASAQERSRWEPRPRTLDVVFDPISPGSDIWLRVQLSPLAPDHLSFLAHLLQRLGKERGRVRLARLDAAFDLEGMVHDLVPRVSFVRRHRYRTSWEDGRRRIWIALGHRGSEFFVRLYDRVVAAGTPPVARLELEWKPPRSRRPLLRELADTPCPLDPGRRVEVLNLRVPNLSNLDRVLLRGIAEHGWRGLRLGAGPAVARQLDGLWEKAQTEGAVRDLSGELNRFWGRGLLYLAEHMRVARLSASSPWEQDTWS